MQLRRKRFDNPDEVRTLEKGRVDIVELGELTVGRAIFEPGWRWSDHVKPIVGMESCQVHHLGYVISGQLHCEMDDGASIELRAGDAFEVPPGHDAWVVGDEPWVSVDYAARWRTLIAEHNQAVRAEIERFDGREHQTTGDGFFVLFDSPARAVRGAAAMLDAAKALDMTARAAVHTGEVQRQGDEVRGIAVHITARILAAAQPGDVLVSSTVRDLLAGSELQFEDRGEFDLRGIEGRRRLAALVRR